MHGRGMEGSRRLIHAAAEAQRLPSKQHVQRWLHNQRGLPPKLSLLVRCTTQTYLERPLRHVRDERSLPPKHSLLYAALRCTTQTYEENLLLRNARLVHNTSNRAGSASVNGASVRCAAAKTIARRHSTCYHGSWLASEAFAPLRCTTCALKFNNQNRIQLDFLHVCMQHHESYKKEDNAARKREERLARSAEGAAARSAVDAARKREERSARPADDAAARSADDAARKRRERSARSAARQHRLQHRLA